MAISVEAISSFVLISSILVSSLILLLYQYFAKLKGIRVQREFLEDVIPIVTTPGVIDLSDTKDNFLVFTRHPKGNKKNNLEIGILVPEQLLAYSFILNPVRLAILKILYDYNQFISSDLRKNLKVSWGAYTAHIKSLIDEGMIGSTDEFVDSKPLKVLYLEDKGRQSFSRLKSLLQEVVV